MGIVIAEIVFFGSLAVAVYTYAGYPVLVFLLSRLRARRVRTADITPSVSIVIAAYNEERDIAARIENCLALDYDPTLLEIIVASDCSSDRTDEIVRGYADRGVVLCRIPERHGKTAAQNYASKFATNEILVFSDATTEFAPDAVRLLVRSYADERVGGVTGHVEYVDRAATAVGRGAVSYWSYEQFIKECESTFGSLIGVHGCIYSIRRSSYRDIDADMSSDFVTASEIHLQGLRAVYEPAAISREDTNTRAKDEFRTRVRMIEQTMRALSRYREVLNPFRHGLYAVQMLSHKLLRYAVPVCLVLALVANVALAIASPLFAVVLAAQLAFYVAAAAGWLMERAGLRLGPIAFPYYFCLSNGASLAALWQFARGERQIVWEPIRETQAPSGAAEKAKTHAAGAGAK